ncbi:MAG: hypothetical protein ACP5HG_14360 [Anaerolineae bacterium]
MGLKIHVEVYIAAHLLARDAGAFTPEELRHEIERRFGDKRSGVATHISAHCVANAPKNAAVISNYLWRLPDGRLRPFNPATDRPHPDRVGARTEPARTDVPAQYRGLLTAPR